MCGIVGFLKINKHYSQEAADKENLTIRDAENILSDMADSLYDRGPNDEGQWFDEDNQLGLAHRRLSVVDPSCTGRQPMHSQCSRFVLIFNGEIYNHTELREILINQSNIIEWRGLSDTETLLMCFKIWGVEQSLTKIQGMFAFALWDCLERTLCLGRDRFGEKPLYYGWQNGFFMFASQLAGLRSHPSFEGQINRQAITLLMRHNCIPAPYSIYQNIHKLEPGQLYTLNTTTNESEIITYWSSKNIAEQLEMQRFKGSETQVLNELERLLKASVEQQMLADVPVGAFLSGGIDSSLVAALMQAQSTQPIKTFSIGFNQDKYNEAQHAKSVADHLGTDHTELYVSEEQLLNVIPEIAGIYDEPFSDSSQIPTYLVSQLASHHVTVALTGDAADELFCGYNRYQFSDRIWRKFVLVPRVLRMFTGKVMSSISINSWNQMNSFLPLKYRLSNLGDKMHKAAGLLASHNVAQLYKGLVSHWHLPEQIVLNAREPQTVLNDTVRKPNLSNDIEQMMLLDVLSYLPDDILAKVDRASMAVSLETRVPFLNHPLVQFAWSLPLHYKLRKGVTKWCLKEVLYKYVPKELLDRPKMGFGVPLGDWLRGPLKEWSQALINEERLVEEGFFDPAPITKMWQEHQSKKRDWQYHLWDVLMFQAWYEKHHK